ncbi:MAG: BRO family protein [Acidithiobacillus sp.]|jgi:prophage antirepressor-like protein|uniref:BRO family protein n=1 Tax=Acidithiobacillus sp. TaxID=1872118 RepID=UPI00355CF5FE
MKNKILTEKDIIITGKVFGISLDFYGEIDNPIFLGKEIAKIIDYAKDAKVNGKYQVSKMLKLVDSDDEKLVLSVVTPGSKQSRDMWFVTEYGLMSILMKVNTVRAVEFRDKLGSSKGGHIAAKNIWKKKAITYKSKLDEVSEKLDEAHEAIVELKDEVNDLKGVNDYIEK